MFVVHQFCLSQIAWVFAASLWPLWTCRRTEADRRSEEFNGGVIDHPPKRPFPNMPLSFLLVMLFTNTVREHIALIFR